MKGLLLITTALVTFTVVLSAGPSMPVMAPPAVPVIASAAATPAPDVAVLAPAKAPPKTATLPSDSEDLAAIVKRGQQFAAAGDVAAARLLLQRAADAHDARAALALGATYDPNVLETLGIRGVVPDIAAARGWYEKAKEYGSAEALRRI
jgi:hypothetical protein